MVHNVALIGFGEAGSSFAGAPRWHGIAIAYDVLVQNEATRAVQEARYREAGVVGSTTMAGALKSASVVLSLVSAEQALAAAQDAAEHLCAGTLYFDMNSVAPETKRAAARAVEAAGARYADVAIMAPVEPSRLAAPLLVAGPHSANGALILRELGFTDVTPLSGDVGRASSVKMIRSVMIKGIEALTAEMLLAGDAAGVSEEVLASLGSEWAAKAAYNLERMASHGKRRAAEMDEAIKTLVALGVDPVMTRGTVVRQRDMAA